MTQEQKEKFAAALWRANSLKEIREIVSNIEADSKTHFERAFYKRESEIASLLAPLFGFKRWKDFPELESTSEAYYTEEYTSEDLARMAAEEIQKLRAK
jgi:hypothetical protein